MDLYLHCSLWWIKGDDQREGCDVCTAGASATKSKGIGTSSFHQDTLPRGSGLSSRLQPHLLGKSSFDDPTMSYYVYVPMLNWLCSF
jgi:hypothetical protein